MPELAIDPRKVGGAFSVEETARRIIHYRFAENVAMTAQGAWASSSPTIKVKFSSTSIMIDTYPSESALIATSAGSPLIGSMADH